MTAFIGPSGCGKSTFLRTLNRMNDIIPGTRVEGTVLIDGQDIYDPGVDVVQLRRTRRHGVPEVEPVPEVDLREHRLRPAHQRHGRRRKAELAERVEESLRQAAIWDEVKDRLHESALALSGGQQQRLCIARALAIRPEILLMDEPASALDPIATQRIEELIYDLKKTYTIVIVTHNMQQAARVSDHTAFFWLGRLVEYDRTDKIFTAPAEKLTEDYVTGGTDGRLIVESGRVFRHFQEELEALKERLLEMGGLAEERVRAAVHGLVERDPAALEAVLTGDEPINDLHIEVDDRCFKLLALHQPMAADLRVIVAAVKINTDLERVGDLAVNIAEAGKRYLQHPPVKPLIDIPRMGDIAQLMLRDALDAFVRRDSALAEAVLANDDDAGRLKTQIFRELLTYMLQNPGTIEPSLDLILISRHLERIGDHATNIAEDVIFMVSARDVRHHAVRHRRGTTGSR